MKKYTKLPLSISITLLTMLGLFYAVSSAILFKNLKHAQEQNTILASQGVQNVLSQTEEDFSNRFADWSSWDDAYEFADKPDPKFIESNLIPQALANLRVDLVLIVKPSGQIIYGTGFNHIRQAKTPLPPQIYQHLTTQDPLIECPLEGKNISGLIVLDQQPMLITARPILTSEGKGPTRGILIFGRNLDQGEINKLSRITRLNINLYPLTQKLSTPTQIIHQELLLEQAPILVKLQPGRFNSGFTTLKDIYDRPAVLMEVQVPNSSYDDEQVSFKYLTIGLTVVGGLFGSLIVFLVHRLVQFLLQRQQMEEALQHETLHDYLTGLANRKQFMMLLERATQKSKHQKDFLFAVLFIDLDHFKMINDSLGHLAGDQVLIETAKRLRHCLRPCDTCARLSGDEFAILLEGLDDETNIHHIAQRIQKDLSTPIILNGEKVNVSASIGTILSDQAYQQAEDFIQAADTAMYRAKASGKGCYECFENSSRNSLLTSIELKRAFRDHEFILYYQPILSLENQEIQSCEALLRWHHPKQGLISPDDFIPIAEESGLIIPLGAWVIREACQQLHTWQTQFPESRPLSINVNFSAKQFFQPDLVGYIQRTLQETGVKAHHLTIELTESMMMDNPHVNGEILQQLHQLGIQIALDDFGTGYSSFSHLDSFPIQTLKIDRSFIRSENGTINRLEIVRSVIDLAADLGLKVVAEGIETAEQLSTLKQLRCPYGQGFFFSRPLNSQMFTLLLESTYSRR